MSDIALKILYFSQWPVDAWTGNFKVIRIFNDVFIVQAFPKLSANFYTIRKRNPAWFFYTHSNHLPVPVSGQFNINQFKAQIRYYFLGDNPYFFVNINERHNSIPMANKKWAMD